MNTTNPKECPQCRGTGWCPGEEADEEFVCSKCGGRGKLRSTTNPAPQEKNSKPLISGGVAVKQNAPGEESPARNSRGLGGPLGSDPQPTSAKGEP